MKPVPHNLLSALSILFLVAASQSRAQTPQRDNRPRTASIGGRITVGGAPAANALVTVEEVEPQSREAAVGDGSLQRAFIKVRTDSDGRYRVTGLVEGAYMIRALSKAYIWSKSSSEFDTFRSVTLDEGETRDNVNIALVRGGVITGRVIDAEGRPMIETYLKLQPVDENGRPKGRFEILFDFMMHTDDRGVFRIYGVPEGRYILSAGEWAYNRAKRKYPETFHPDATDRNRAKVIEMKEGAEVTGVDIRLGVEINTYEAMGRVVDAETGRPLSHVPVVCSAAPDKENGARGFGRTVITDDEGRFKVNELPSGAYELFVRNESEMYGPTSVSMLNSEYYSEKIRFVLGDSDVNGLEVKAIRGSTV